MNRMRAFRWVIASISILAVLEAAPAAADFTILELGTLGGPYHAAQAINNAGQVVGRSYTASGVEHAFLWQNGTMTDLGTLGGSYSHALGINEAGQVAGFSMTFGDPFRHAFLWQNGTMTDLGTLGDSLIDTRATAINNAGQVVGHASSVTVGGPQHAFLWQNGTMTDLGTLGGTHSGASGINEAGQVIGSSTTAGDASAHAFLWQNGTMTDLGTLGGNYSEATGINNVGQVVGISTTADGAYHAFLWQDGTMIDLDSSGGTFSRAWGINDAGQVVGDIGYVIFDEFGYDVGVVYRAFLWTSSEGMVALDSLIPPNSGWEQLAAMGINEVGEIVGSGLFRGESRAFMLTTGRLMARAHADFDGDGRSDVLWRNSATGANYAYFMNGPSIASEGYLRQVASQAFQIAGIGDFDGDGKADILWRNSSTGENYIYFMNGSVTASEGYIRTVADQNWKVAGVGDFDGDGKEDILWRHTITGENYVYPMNGLTIKAGEGYLRTVADTSWQIVGVADFDGDGRSDVLWRNTISGQNYVYLMNGLAIKPTEGYLRFVADAAWQVKAVGDFDGDGKADIVWRHSGSGENYLYPMDGRTIKPTEGYLRTVSDLSWQIVAAADYDGDGKTDLLWRNSSSGENYLYPMDGTTIKASEGYLRSVADMQWQVQP